MTNPVDSAAATPGLGVPPLTAPVRPRKPSVTDRTLDSGLRVVAVRKPGVPLVELRLRVPFASPRPERPAQASLLSDVMLTGTDRYDRAGLAAAVQALGGDLSVGVNSDRLLLSGSVLATALRPMLDLVADVLTGATYVPGEVETERARLVERLTIARSRAQTIAHEALARAMFGDHPYAHDLPQIGDVQAVTPAQLRRLHKSTVLPGGATLVVVGDVTPGRAIAQVEAALADWTGAGRNTRMPKLPPITGGPVQLVDRPGSVQSSVRLGTAALRRTDDAYPALQLANLVFGGYFSSRWTENLREDKGYTYGPHSRIEHDALGSTLTLDADVSTDVTAPSLLETEYELGRISTLPVTEAEVESVRQYATGTLALSIATQAGLASTLSALLGNGVGVEWLSEHPRRLAKVTVEEVSAAAAEFFAPARFARVVVGDAATVAGPLARLTSVESVARDGR